MMICSDLVRWLKYCRRSVYIPSRPGASSCCSRAAHPCSVSACARLCDPRPRTNSPCGDGGACCCCASRCTHSHPHRCASHTSRAGSAASSRTCTRHARSHRTGSVHSCCTSAHPRTCASRGSTRPRPCSVVSCAQVARPRTCTTGGPRPRSAGACAQDTRCPGRTPRRTRSARHRPHCSRRRAARQSPACSPSSPRDSAAQYRSSGNSSRAGHCCRCARHESSP